MREEPAYTPFRPRGFQKANEAARFDHAAKLLQAGDLLLIGKNAKQKTRDRGVEIAIRKGKLRDIHLAQLDVRSERLRTLLCPHEHCRTEIDADDGGSGRIKRNVPSSAGAGVKNSP